MMRLTPSLTAETLPVSVQSQMVDNILESCRNQSHLSAYLLRFHLSIGEYSETKIINILGLGQNKMVPLLAIATLSTTV